MFVDQEPAPVAVVPRLLMQRQKVQLVAFRGPAFGVAALRIEHVPARIFQDRPARHTGDHIVFNDAEEFDKGVVAQNETVILVPEGESVGAALYGFLQTKASRF